MYKLKSKEMKVKVIKAFPQLKEILELGDEVDLVTKTNEYGYSFVSRNGGTYDDITIRNAIGHVPMKDLFEKI